MPKPILVFSKILAILHSPITITNDMHMLGLAQRITRPVAGAIYKSTPLNSWPKWPADLLRIKTPSNVIPKPHPTASGGANINILLRLLEQTREIPGSIAECGVYRGSSLISMALHNKQNSIDKHIYGFDSFEGFDDSVNTDIELGGEDDIEKRKGGFSDTSKEFVESRIKILCVEDQVTLHKGFFESTLQNVDDKTFSFVHLDCDIYESYKQCLNFFYARLEKGAVVLLDEYNDLPWPGCNQAVDEFLSDKPESLIEIESDNYLKHYFVKS